MNISKKVNQRLKKLKQQYAVVITREDIDKNNERDDYTDNTKGTTATYYRRTLHR